MNDKEVISELRTKLADSHEHFLNELKKLRTGRAHPSMVDDVKAEVYESQMPLNQLATVTTPEPQLIQISPFDPTNIEAITSAIRNNQTLGLNPVDDGRVIRIQIPALTEERRLQIVKQLKEKQEQGHIGIRKARHDAIGVVDKAKKAKELGEDDASRMQKQIDDMVSTAKGEIDSASSSRESEIMTV